MPPDNHAPAELTSWKEIADHLGVTVRTAQKWEAERGLPVRRLAGEKGRVSATTSGLERWRRSALEKPGWWASLTFLRIYAAAATALLLVGLGVALGLYLSGSRKGPPAEFLHDVRTLVVTDRSGRELWRRTFDDPFQHGITPETILDKQQAWFGDLDGDGRIELLYAYCPSTRASRGSTLFCFSEDGGERWRFVPGRTVSTPADTVAPPYLVNSFMVLPAGENGTRRIAVASHHLSFYPAQIVVLSDRNVPLGEYWHSGHLGYNREADVDGDGRVELLLTGVNNGRKTATLVVLDPEDLAGASDEAEAPAYQILGLGPGREKARILFPRSCVNRQSEQYNWVSELEFVDGSIHLSTAESLDNKARRTAAVYYTLGRNLELLNVGVNDYLRTAHRELEASGQLDHRFTAKELDAFRNIRVLKHWRRDATTVTAHRSDGGSVVGGKK